MGGNPKKRLALAAVICFLEMVVQIFTLSRHPANQRLHVVDDIPWLTTTMLHQPVLLPNIARSRNRTTLQKFVRAANNSEGCQGDYRNYPVEVQDRVNELLSVAMMREPAVAVRNDQPPGTPDIDKLCAVKPFVGPTAKNSTNPSPLFLAYMFSHEIELLEARLYEGMGVVDKHFIGESGYTHRGHRKRKFATELLATARFQRFANVVEIVDLDEHCPDTYLATILQYRSMHPHRPQDIWDTQIEAQNCLAAAIRAYAEQHAPDALVHTSDLDEIPLRNALVSVKECQLPSHQSFPVTFSTTFNAGGKLCQPPSPYVIPGMLFRAINMTGQRRPLSQDYFDYEGNNNTIRGGVHLTYFGGSLVEFFKTSNHAEGGQMNTLGWLNASYNPTVCEATRDDWYRREELLCTDTGTVIQPWLDASPPRNEKAPVPVSDDFLPWVVAQNRERYPCFFDNHGACVDTYIDVIL